MSARIFRNAPLALALALACGSPIAFAAEPGKDAQQAELAAARADLEAAAQRVARLSGHAVGALHVTTDGTDTPPRLGVLLTGDAQPGVRITGVTPGSGAAQAGLKSGDRLLRIKSRSITGDSPEQRVAQARAALAGLSAGQSVRLAYLRDGRQHEIDATPRVDAPSIVVSRYVAQTNGVNVSPLVSIDGSTIDLQGLAPRIRSEVMHFGRASDCEGADCPAPLLVEALRWNGLHLTRLNPQLGRYFGSDSGVLVLAQGTLPGLEAGDVIRAIEGKAVGTPQEAMRAMAARTPGEQARLTILREKRERDVLVTVPERGRGLEFVPVPPAPPAPPAVPAAPPSPAAPAPPPAPPPPAAPAIAALVAASSAQVLAAGI